MKHQYKVMLIDDDYITNLINSSIFESLEDINQVSCFTNPATALHYLYKRCAGGESGLPVEPFPDLLLVDIKMVLFFEVVSLAVLIKTVSEIWPAVKGLDVWSQDVVFDAHVVRVIWHFWPIC